MFEQLLPFSCSLLCEILGVNQGGNCCFLVLKLMTKLAMPRKFIKLRRIDNHLVRSPPDFLVSFYSGAFVLFLQLLDILRFCILLTM